jgi:hypothetical protein
MKNSILFIFVFFFLTIALFSLYFFVSKNEDPCRKPIKRNEYLSSFDSRSDFYNSKNLVVFLIIGQSNAANYAEINYIAKEQVYLFNNGKIFKAEDPLLGTSGCKGSPWLLFADDLISKGFCDKVLLIPLAKGGTTIENWAIGDCANRLNATLNRVSKDGFQPNYIIFQQGEEDNVLQTSYNQYVSLFNVLSLNIKRSGFLGKMFVSLSTYSPTSVTPVNAELRAAQKRVIDDSEWIEQGPDTDLIINVGDRYDGIHFSKKGVRKLALDWSRIIINKG